MQRTAFLYLTALSTLTNFAASAQSDFLGLPVTSYIENIANSQFMAEEERADEDRFWTTRHFSGTYSYSHFNGKSRSIRQHTHAFVPEIYLESDSGWILNVGGLYAHNSTREDSFFPEIEAEADSYAISVQPAYDLFRLWSTDERPEVFQQSRLIAGVAGAYGHTEGEADFRTGFFPSTVKLKTRGDSYFISPNLVFVQPLSERLQALLIPAYTFTWSKSKVRGTSIDSSIAYHYFSLTGRGDYQLCERLVASAFATWTLDMHHSLMRLVERDWVEVGGQFRYALNDRIGMRAGYSYEYHFSFRYRVNRGFIGLYAEF